MTAAKLLNILTLATIAILASSFGATPANALSVESHNFVRRHADHHLIAKRQQSTSTKANRKRCRARVSTSLSAPVSTSPAKPTSSSVAPAPAPTSSSQPAPKPTTSQAPAPAPPKTTSQAPAPSPTPPPSSGGGGKACIAWANSGEDRFPNFVSWKTSVYYTWSPWKVAAASKTGIDFAAMLWGEKQIGDFTRLVKPGYAKYILGFNEPNQAGQALLSPGHAADLWAQYIEPLSHQGFITVSPAPTNAPSGLQWLKDWLAACGGRCNPRFIATHFYGTRASDLIAHLEQYYAAFNKPLWLTEFACQSFGGGAQCGPGDVVNFMNTATTWMDSSYKVDRYCWFGFLDNMSNVNYANKLIGGDNRPNDLGRNYLDI
jgi:hypothetical protein